MAAFANCPPQLIINDFIADPNMEGKIRFRKLSDGMYSAFVCVHKYNEYQWEPLHLLSSANWMSLRDEFSDAIVSVIKSICDFQEKKEKKKEKSKKIISSLLETMNKEQVTQWVKSNPSYKERICMRCHKFDPKKKKCIHNDCCGMCETCFDAQHKEGFTHCKACNKKQEITCPICQEDFPINSLTKSESCSHHICWKCFGMAVKAQRPIADCPLCRATFCQYFKQRQRYYDSSSDEELGFANSDDEMMTEDELLQATTVLFPNGWVDEDLDNHPNITVRENNVVV